MHVVLPLNAYEFGCGLSDCPDCLAWPAISWPSRLSSAQKGAMTPLADVGPEAGKCSGRCVRLGPHLRSLYQNAAYMDTPSNSAEIATMHKASGRETGSEIGGIAWCPLVIVARLRTVLAEIGVSNLPRDQHITRLVSPPQEL